MAIENIWIIDSSSGICLYDWFLEKKKAKLIDEQLVSGLLVAFKNFSSEAGLVDISAIEGIDRKLAYKSVDKFIIAGICHLKDFEPLVNKTLLKLLSNFRNKFKQYLDGGLATDVSPFRAFDHEVEDELSGRSANRNLLSLIVGSIPTLAIFGISFVGYFFLLTFLTFAGDILVGFLTILLGLFVGGFIGGFIAGDRKYGAISSSISVLPVIVLLIAFFQQSWGDFATKFLFSLLYLILFLAFAILGGICGGFLKESKYFYPEMAEKLDEK